MTYLKDVTTLLYNRNLCTGCAMCVNVCPHHVFIIVERKAMVISKDNCMECGACMMNCSAGAISVQKGVGCAYAIISSKLKGSSEISCGCSGEDSKSSGSCCC